MKFNDSRRKQIGETDNEETEVPEDFICIDPQQKPFVFDFLNAFDRDFNIFNQDLKESALIHLKLCLHCRELAEIVLKTNRYLEPKSGQYLHAENSEIAIDTEQVS